MKILDLPAGWKVILDDEDEEIVRPYRWFAKQSTKQSQVYVYGAFKAHSGIGMVAMHRLIMRAPKGTCVDHINGTHVCQFIDNQKSNLRLCNHSMNSRNRQGPTIISKSGYLCVFWSPHTTKWIGRVAPSGKSVHVGSFDTAQAAHEAVEKWKLDHNYAGLLTQ